MLLRDSVFVEKQCETVSAVSIFMAYICIHYLFAFFVGNSKLKPVFVKV